ncbi:hypothetical protein JCM1393_23000 [Clostridium carnis]
MKNISKFLLNNKKEIIASIIFFFISLILVTLNRVSLTEFQLLNDEYNSNINLLNNNKNKYEILNKESINLKKELEDLEKFFKERSH